MGGIGSLGYGQILIAFECQPECFACYSETSKSVFSDWEGRKMQRHVHISGILLVLKKKG
jgi:hypothetical protein